MLANARPILPSEPAAACRESRYRATPMPTQRWPERCCAGPQAEAGCATAAQTVGGAPLTLQAEGGVLGGIPRPSSLPPAARIANSARSSQRGNGVGCSTSGNRLSTRATVST
jgi:hypothetical protein